MNPSELIKYHEEAIELLELLSQESINYRSRRENTEHYKRIGLLSLSEKESHRADISLMCRDRLKDSYNRLMENFN